MKTPVSYQHFHNSQFGLKNVAKYFCKGVFPLFLNFKSLCVNLVDTKTEATSNIYPNLAKQERCTMMMLSNLAEPDWIQINCEQKLLANILCVSGKSPGNIANNTNQNRTMNNLICPSGYFRTFESCYSFIWHSATDMVDLDDKCKEFDLSPLPMDKLNTFEYVFEATEAQFPPILVPDKFSKSNM